MDKIYKLWVSPESQELVHWGVQIIDGEYKGVVVEIINFTSPDYNDGDSLGDILDDEAEVNLSVEFQVIHHPEDFDRDKFSKKEFADSISDILNQVLRDIKDKYSVDNNDIKVVDDVIENVKENINEQNRTSDTKEPDSQ